MKIEQLRLQLRDAPEYKAPEPPGFHRDRLLLTLRTKMDKVIFDEGETRLIDNMILEGLIGVTGDNLYCLTSKGKFAVADILNRVATPSAEPVRMPKVDWTAVPDDIDRATPLGVTMKALDALAEAPATMVIDSISSKRPSHPWPDLPPLDTDDIFNDDW